MGSNPSWFKGDNRPVEQVSWDDCQLFLSRLRTLTGYDFRLPTEAEWEYAARGGNRSRGYVFSGSDNLYNVAWYKDNSDMTTHDVGGLEPNELGLYDMAGNVDEWCSDFMGDYIASPAVDPKGPATGDFRVERGGCWNMSLIGCYICARGSAAPDLRHTVGLRLALSE